jgi:hypothetical protein
VAGSVPYAIVAAPITTAPEPAPRVHGRVVALDLRARAPPPLALPA